MQKQFHDAIADFSNAGHEYFEAAVAIRKLGGTSVDFNQMSELLGQASASYKKVLLIGQYRIVEFSQLESDMLLAEAHYQIGRVHARASAVYTLQNKPNESERLYDQSERDFQKAIVLCHKHSLADMPEYHPTLLADIHFEKGRLYTEREVKLGFAIQEYEFAGLNYEDGRYFSNAVKAYNVVVKIDPDYANPYFYLGRTYERYAVAHETEEFDKYIEAAIAYYRLALQNLYQLRIQREQARGMCGLNQPAKQSLTHPN